MADTHNDGLVNGVRNPEGIWINTQYFKEEGNRFMKNGFYCPDPWGSPDWYEYWTRERNRCLDGYSVGGAKITGGHYFYLNYCPIQKVENAQASQSKKIKGFPDFWDGDYNYFWSREIARHGIMKALGLDQEEQEVVLHMEDKQQAEELKKYLETLYLEVKILPNALLGGYDLIIGKSRRKGYSYKNASVAACNFFHRPNSYTMFMAYEKKYLYPKGIFNMTQDYINFINENTAWRMPSDIVNKQDHIRASYIEYQNGIKIEKGFKSEIQAITFKDNPDAGRGKDCYDIIGEEVGAWGVPGGLKATHSAMLPSVTAGSIKTGMQTYFGTSGDIEGGTVDFADMHSRPEAFGFLPFYDVWGEYENKVEGFFHPTQWNMEGFYDAQGNSDLEGAKNAELAHRQKLIDNGATSSEIQARMQEHPTNSAEAFSIISTNNFPVVELKAQLEKVKAEKLQFKKGTPVTLYYEGQNCKAKPILDGSAQPIISYKDLPFDKKGCIMVYEHPVPDAPKGLYKIGYDPIRQDDGTSLAAIIVYKGVHIGTTFHDIVVAEYIGRLDSADDIDHIAEKLADFYNTTIMHENEVTGVKNYFRRIKRLGLLAAQPDLVISKNVKSSRVARVYGCHMTVQLKDAGERYVKEWLLKILNYDENGDPIRVIDTIYSIRLLEELIAYHRDGNFDLCSALFMCMFQVQEEELDKQYDSKKENQSAQKLIAMRTKMYGGRKDAGISRNF
jgi:hypothetical protein